MDIKAEQKFVPTSPRKLREVVEAIEKLKPVDAYERLPFVKKRAAEVLRKVVGTAIANARQAGISEAELIFKEIQINQGPGRKRYRAGARGRAKPYKRRMSHIRVILTDRVESGQKSGEKITEHQGNLDKKPAGLETLKKATKSLGSKTEKNIKSGKKGVSTKI